MSKQKANEYKNQGNKFFSQGKFQEAITWYTKAIKEDPNDSAFYSNRCAAYMGINKIEDALKDAESCIRTKPDWVKGYYRKGVALVTLQRYEEAAGAFKEALKLEPNNDDIKQKFENAQERAKYIIKKVDEHGKPLSPAMLAKEEGNVLFRLGKYDQAIEKYSRAIALAKTEDEKATYYSNRALAYAQGHHHENVVADCTEAINRTPNAKVYIRRGLAYEMLEKYKAGLDDMKDALALDPNAKVASEAIARLTKAVNAFAY